MRPAAPPPRHSRRLVMVAQAAIHVPRRPAIPAVSSWWRRPPSTSPAAPPFPPSRHGGASRHPHPPPPRHSRRPVIPAQAAIQPPPPRHSRRPVIPAQAAIQPPPPPLSTMWRGGRGVRPAALRPLSSPHPRRYDPCGEWQMQDHPGAPGTARQSSTRTVPAACGGAAAHPPRAPGPDHPPVTTTRAPGYGRPCAAHRALGQRRPRLAQWAPGQGRPSVAPSSAVELDRPRAASRALGQWRPRPAQRAPDQDVPLAVSARAPGPDRPCAGTSVPSTTTLWPARVSRLLQDGLAAATSHTLTYSHSHHTAHPRYAARRSLPSHPHSHSTTHPVHPATQLPPRPPPCSTTSTGCPLRHPARAPPAASSPCKGDLCIPRHSRESGNPIMRPPRAPDRGRFSV